MKKKKLCTCGKTRTPPYCDHSHQELEKTSEKKRCASGKTGTPPYCDHSHQEPEKSPG